MMEFVAQVGERFTDGLAYVGALAFLVSRAAYCAFVGPFQGKPLRWQGAVSQATEVGVRALPILSLITFFIGLILALQSAYELRKLGALSYVASAVAISVTRELGPLITAILVIGRSGGLPGGAEVPGDDRDDAVFGHLGELDGDSRRLAVRRRAGRFHLGPVYAQFARRAVFARHCHRPDQERDVWHYDYRGGLSRRAFHRSGGGGNWPIDDPGGGHLHFPGDCRRSRLYGAFFLRRQPVDGRWR